MMIGSWVALGVLGATSRQELALELVNVADHPQAKCLDGNPPTPRAPHTKHRTCQACAESSSPLPNASADSPISRCTPLTCHATAIAPVLWGCGNVAVGTQSGSSPAFWFQAATNVTHANHWQIYFQGRRLVLLGGRLLGPIEDHAGVIPRAARHHHARRHHGVGPRDQPGLRRLQQSHAGIL